MLADLQGLPRDSHKIGALPPERLLPRMLTRRRFLQSVGGLFGAAAGLGSYGLIIEPGLRLSLARWTVPHPDWPASSPPLRIAVISDIHAVRPWMPASRIERIAETANGLGADLIVLLGDYVTGVGQRFRNGLVPIADWSAALRGLKAPLGVYAILGNHDWWVDAPAVRRGLESQGIPVLENDVVKFDNGKRRFWLAGLGDQLAMRAPGGGWRGVDDLNGTVARMAGDRDPVIMLAHEPDIFVKVPRRIGLTLSGHTHGGQIWLPFIGRPVVPSRYGQRFAYGHIVEDGRHLVVSAGLGLSILPVRFMVPPELALVTVTAPGNAGEPV